MSDLKGLLDREARTVSGGSDAFERMTRRARRRQVRRRVATGTLALAIAAVGSLAAVVGLRPGGEEGRIPAGPQAQTLTAEIGGVTIDYPSDWTLLDLRDRRTILPNPTPRSLLELTNVKGESCLGGTASGLTADTVVLHVLELTGNTPPAPPWPVELAPVDGGPSTTCLGTKKIVFTERTAEWRAAERVFSATLLVGSAAAQADVDRALTAFRSLRFAPGGPIPAQPAPRQVVGSGRAWMATASRRSDGTVCIDVSGQLSGCFFEVRGDTYSWGDTWTAGVRVVVGEITGDVRSVTINDIPARVVRPLDRFGLGGTVLFAAGISGRDPVTIEVRNADGTGYAVAEPTSAPTGPPPMPPTLTPPPPIGPDSRNIPSIEGFVGDFASARIAGAPRPELETFLSESARSSYGSHEDGLSYYGEDGVGAYTGYRVRALEEQSEGYRVRLTMRVESGNCFQYFDEELIVGGDERGGWLILEASRPGMEGEGCIFFES